MGFVDHLGLGWMSSLKFKFWIDSSVQLLLTLKMVADDVLCYLLASTMWLKPSFEVEFEFK